MKALVAICCYVLILSIDVVSCREIKESVIYNPPVISLNIKNNGDLFVGDIQVEDSELMKIFSQANERKWFLIVYFEDGSSKKNISSLVQHAVQNGCYQVILFETPEDIGKSGM